MNNLPAKFKAVPVWDGAHYYARGAECLGCHATLVGTGATPESAEVDLLKQAMAHVCHAHIKVDTEA